MTTINYSRLARLTHLPETHKGCDIGYFSDPRWINGELVDSFTAAWRWPDGRWHEGNIIVRSVAEIFPLARECIDYELVVLAMEKELGRKLEISELPHLNPVDYSTKEGAK